MIGLDLSWRYSTYEWCLGWLWR